MTSAPDQPGYIDRLWLRAEPVIDSWLGGCITAYELAHELLTDEAARPLLEARFVEEGHDPANLPGHYLLQRSLNVVSHFQTNYWRSGDAQGFGPADGYQRNPDCSPRPFAAGRVTAKSPSQREVDERDDRIKGLWDDDDVDPSGEVGVGRSADAREIRAIKDYAERCAYDWLLRIGWQRDEISPPQAVGEDYLCQRGNERFSVEVKGTKLAEPRVTLRGSQVRRARKSPQANALFVVYGVRTQFVDGKWQCSDGQQLVQSPFDPSDEHLIVDTYKYNAPPDLYQLLGPHR